MNWKNVSEELLKQAQHTETKYDIIDSLKELSKVDKNKFYVLVQWAGQSDKFDQTWQELHQVYQDVPEMIQEIMETQSQGKAIKEARQLLGIWITRPKIHVMGSLTLTLPRVW